MAFRFCDFVGIQVHYEQFLSYKQIISTIVGLMDDKIPPPMQSLSRTLTNVPKLENCFSCRVKKVVCVWLRSLSHWFAYLVAW